MPIFTEPILSACIVLHNPGMRLLQTVQCFQESDIALELHVVDNAPHGTLIDHLKWQCPGIVYYPQRKGLGYAGGHNAVLPCLRSRYHIICHPDVTFDPQLLSDMVSYMECNPSCIILTPKFVDADGREVFVPRRLPTIRYLIANFFPRLPGPFRTWRDQYTLDNTEIYSPISVEMASGAFMMIRTQALQQMNGMDPLFFYTHADSDLSRRALEIGAIVYHPLMTVTHDRQPKSRNLPEILKRFGCTLRYLKKWEWRR